MLQYKFVEVDLKGFLNNTAEEDYHEIIHEHAREGWKLFQIFAPNAFSMRSGPYVELIFERMVKEYH